MTKISFPFHGILSSLGAFYVLKYLIRIFIGFSFNFWKFHLIKNTGKCVKPCTQTLEIWPFLTLKWPELSTVPESDVRILRPVRMCEVLDPSSGSDSIRIPQLDSIRTLDLKLIVSFHVYSRLFLIQSNFWDFCIFFKRAWNRDIYTKGLSTNSSMISCKSNTFWSKYSRSKFP